MQTNFTKKICSILVLATSSFIFSCSDHDPSINENRDIKLLISAEDSIYFNKKSNPEGTEFYFTSYGKKEGAAFLYNLRNITSKKIYLEDKVIQEKRYTTKDAKKVESFYRVENDTNSNKIFFYEFLNETIPNSPCLKIGIPIFTYQNEDTFSLNSSSVTHLQVLDTVSETKIDKYDWRLPWIGFKNPKLAKIVVNDLKKGLNTYTYNVALLNEFGKDDDSLILFSRVIPIDVPIIRVEKKTYDFIHSKNLPKIMWW